MSIESSVVGRLLRSGEVTTSSIRIGLSFCAAIFPTQLFYNCNGEHMHTQRVAEKQKEQCAICFQDQSWCVCMSEYRKASSLSSEAFPTRIVFYACHVGVRELFFLTLRQKTKFYGHQHHQFLCLLNMWITQNWPCLTGSPHIFFQEETPGTSKISISIVGRARQIRPGCLRARIVPLLAMPCYGAYMERWAPDSQCGIICLAYKF